MNKMKFGIIYAFLIIGFMANGQKSDSLNTQELANVYVRAFEKNRTWLNSPDALSIIDSGVIRLGNSTSFLPALNSQAGIRMEERSPGSFRIAVRGSSLRAPFGVRNIKVYWNQIPFTDAGNNSYFSILDPDLFQNIVISKGPTGGLYGAGTGGVILLNSQTKSENSVQHQSMYNSLGGYRQTWDVSLATKSTQQKFYSSFWQQEGYRDQSAMKKQLFNYQLDHQFGTSGEFHLMAYYADLAYQTPGGLTLKQFSDNPKQARPAAGAFKSAIEQMATFHIKTLGIGTNIGNQWNGNWSWNLINAFQSNQIINPTIRNYEIRNEPNLSSRGVVHYKNDGFSFDAGYEYQIGKFDSQTFANLKGNKDALQFTQNTSIQQLSSFFQSEYNGLKNWNFLLSGSLNHYWTEYQNNEAIFSPRLSIIRYLNKHQNISFKIANGFSPPSIAELRPSTGAINSQLKAEKGWNYELSYRGETRNKQLHWEINAYQFDLNETISLRRTADGADYFVNVGQTRQKGLEVSLSYQLNNQLQIHSASSFQNYRFVDYSNLTKSFAGNFLTGTSPFSQSIFVSWKPIPQLNWNNQYLFTDYIYLNDANTDILPASKVWNSKISFENYKGHLPFSLWISIDNLLNEKYSAGPDLNAVGLRYYNTSALRNYSLGIQFKIK
jgi:iron complex outermembrane receptor protein